MKDYNVVIDGRNFNDQPVKTDKITYENIRKIAMGMTVQLYDCTTVQLYQIILIIITIVILNIIIKWLQYIYVNTKH